MGDEPAVLAARGPAARRELVRRRVLTEGFARLDDLARAFDVSVMTMHRDVDALAAEGWLTKIRGGATANPSALVDAGVRERSAAMRAEKAAIVAAAAGMLGHGQMLFLDDSTTAVGLVGHATAHPPVTIATNFLPAVAAAGGAAGVSVHLLGGQYQHRQEACLGRQTVELVGRFHADIAFLSTTALSGGRCLYRSEAEVMVREAFMRHASRTVLLVDHAKFGRPAPHLLCGVEAFDAVVTDDGVDPEDLADLRARCAEVLVAPVRR